MSSLLPLQFMGVGISSPFDSNHAECFAYVSANNVRPIRTYVSANIHFLYIMRQAPPFVRHGACRTAQDLNRLSCHWCNLYSLLHIATKY